MKKVIGKVVFKKDGVDTFILDASDFQTCGCPQSGSIIKFQSWALDNKLMAVSIPSHDPVTDAYEASYMLFQRELSTFCPACGKIYWKDEIEKCPRCQWSNVVFLDVEEQLSHYMFLVDMIRDVLEKSPDLTGNVDFANRLKTRLEQMPWNGRRSYNG